MTPRSTPASPWLALDIGAIVRDSTPLRVGFLHRLQSGGGAGPLAAFVRERRGTALDLLLFAHTIAPLSNPEPIQASSSEWLRAISPGTTRGDRSTISRSWTWLEQMRLIETERRGRERAIRLLCEDGSGRPWRTASDEGEPYFRLPLAYWTGGFSRDLSLPGKAVLLIGLSLQARKEFFELPQERGAGWYGLSPSTLQRGLVDLRGVGLLRRWAKERPTDGSPLGVTYDQRYALNSLENVGSHRPDPYYAGFDLDSGEPPIPF
jgi:DNA-binding transcriptional ArsR family regulator